MRNSKLRFFGAAAAAFLMIQAVDVHVPSSPVGASINLSTEAFARTSGGRSRGGSFKSRSRPSSPSRSYDSAPSRSAPSRSAPSGGSYNRQNDYRYDRPSYGGGGTVIVPVPVPNGGAVYSDPNRSYDTRSPNNYPNTANSQTSSEDDWIMGLIFLAILGGVTFFVIFLILRSLKHSMGSTAGIGGAAGELDNDVVTISKIQVALLAQARQVQTELTEIVENYDPETPEGLLGQLQETTLALLRTPENWSHVQTSSQSVKGFDEAQRVFEQMSIAERSKFSVESLVRVGGKVTRRAIKLDPDEAPASYIVVTLLIGTAYDKPLFDEIHTTEQLTLALERIASISSDHLMVFELLWSPQDPSDSLTYDELLTEYSDMAQL
jgi:uncharacterized membrane protein